MKAVVFVKKKKIKKLPAKWPHNIVGTFGPHKCIKTCSTYTHKKIASSSGLFQSGLLARYLHQANGACALGEPRLACQHNATRFSYVYFHSNLWLFTPLGGNGRIRWWWLRIPLSFIVCAADNVKNRLPFLNGAMLSNSTEVQSPPKSL